MKIHLLDMGKTHYGDCLVLTHQNQRILIDGAHPGDRDFVLTQLKQILNEEEPFIFDLLIVTHCHSDHIGCLPDLLSKGNIKISAALVADEKLGFGHPLSPVFSTDASASEALRTLTVALQEEDQSTLPDQELALFLADAATLEDKYHKMLDDLAEQGVPVVRYGHDDMALVRQLERKFAEFSLQILGPTPAHLQLCYQELSNTTNALEDAFRAGFTKNSMTEFASTYKELVQQFVSDAAFDRVGPGAAKNNQSIVLKVGSESDWCALLAGDMQFAKPEIASLTNEMSLLRSVVKKAGPYDFIKLTHHTSDNGLDASVLDEWAATTNFAHTGGLQDPTHPNMEPLKLLESKHKQNKLHFARTDHNGLITVTKAAVMSMVISRGSLNDFTPNTIKSDNTGAQPLVVKAPTLTPLLEKGVDVSIVAAHKTMAQIIRESLLAIPKTQTDQALPNNVIAQSNIYDLL